MSMYTFVMMYITCCCSNCASFVGICLNGVGALSVGGPFISIEVLILLFFCINDLNLRKDKSSRKFRRSIYVVKNIKKGQYIDNLNIKKIRPSNGLHPKYYFKILGKKVNKNILAGKPMKLSYVT